MSERPNPVPQDPAAKGWHVDRRIPLVLLMALTIQTAGIVWWAASISADVDKNRTDIARIDQTHSAAIREVKSITDGIPGRLIRIETSMEFLAQAMASVDNKIEGQRSDRLRDLERRSGSGSGTGSGGNK